MSSPQRNGSEDGLHGDRLRLSAASAAGVAILACAAALAAGVYQEPADFIDQAFSGAPPAPAALWVTPDRRAVMEEILGHPPGEMRLRYWRRNDRTAWIVEEIGKEKPITTGIVVEDGRIRQLKVLIFRESRGWEVRYDFFTDQFLDATATAGHRLDRDIDGISGATLSVRAITKLARLALYLDAQARADG